MLSFLAVIWHWWAAVFLAANAVFIIGAVIFGYVYKVQRQKYPRRQDT